MITAESASRIKQLLNTTVTCLRALTNMGIDTSSCDIIINNLVISKRDNEKMRQWEQHISVKSKLPTWSELQLNLESRFRSMEIIGCNNNKNKSLLAKFIPKTKSFHTNMNNQIKNNEIKNSQIKCILCSNDHYIDKSRETRNELIESKELINKYTIKKM